MFIDILYKKLYEILISYYYCFVIFFYFMTFVISDFPVGVVNSILIFLIGLGYILKYGISFNIKKIDVVVGIYFCYCCVSSLFYFTEEMVPISIFFKAFSNSLMPIFFYVIGKKGIFKFWKSYVFAIIVCGIVGTFLLWSKPTWYIEYCLKYGYSFSRLSSSIGSTAIGTLSVVGIVACIKYINEKQRGAWKIKYMLCILFSLLSMQRSAWIVGILAVIYLHYLIFKKNRWLKLRWFVLEIIFLLAVLVILREKILEIFRRWFLEKEYASINGGSSAMFERAKAWVEGIKHSNILFGSGYGSRSHKAMEYIEYTVNDGSWIELLCGVGIIGVLLFIIVILVCLAKGMKHIRELYMPTMIIIMICLQAIGSNIFEFQITTPLFWISIGQIRGYQTINLTEEDNENISNVLTTISCNS